MEHTLVISASELERYADTRDSEAVIPELICLLVRQSVADLTACRIPYDAINQPGLDGFVETETGFRQFVPTKRSYWEIGTGGNPQTKATTDFAKRTKGLSADERQASVYVFLTPRGPGTKGWPEPAQRKWLNRRKNQGWRDVRILDGTQLADWVREFPALGRWLMKKMGLAHSAATFATPGEHWENLVQLTRLGDPPLPPQIFLEGRQTAMAQLHRLFAGEIRQLVLAVETDLDAEDFVAAFLASRDSDTQRAFANRCLFVRDAEAWLSFTHLKSPHVLVAHPKLDLEASGEQMRLGAQRGGHAIVVPVSGTGISDQSSIFKIRSPSASMLERVFTEAGYDQARARELATAGTLSLAALKRNLGGFGELPAYAATAGARLLAQAELLGRWVGESDADRAAVETIVGKAYGEWIESARRESLRSDAPLTQRGEKWKVISRGEAWSALGPQLSNDDLDRVRRVALNVLGEVDPAFDLSRDERFAASMHGKVLQHSGAIRAGLAETLALLGSRPQVLSSVTVGKAESVASAVVRELLNGADWKRWASLNDSLPMLAEASPGEFLASIEAALVEGRGELFRNLFAQESTALGGWNYMSGVLWGLETLAWHPDYLNRVTLILGDLAAIDPGGNWANRPEGALVDIFLPWHPQTCASISKRRVVLETLLGEHRDIGWKVLLSLLPRGHTVTSGARKPTWRNFIPPEWTDGVSRRDYSEQVQGYADLAVTIAATDLTKLAELIDRLPDLPRTAYVRVLEHLASEAVVALSEDSRVPLWESLIDLAVKHQRFSTAQWAMSQDAVLKVEEVASKLAPRSSMARHHRLFSGRDYDLYAEKGNYQEQNRRLDIRRRHAVLEIFGEGKLEAVLNFANRVDAPWKVGYALGTADVDETDQLLLPDFLEEASATTTGFVAGYVAGRHSVDGWVWVDRLVQNVWSSAQIAKYLSLLPFTAEAWERAEALLRHHASIYWKSVRVNPWGESKLSDAAEKLVIHGRPDAALACIHAMIHGKAELSPALVVNALKGLLASQVRPEHTDQSTIIDAIKWLQEQPETKTDDLFGIEWAFLALLERDLTDAAPKTLERRLATDPMFFCELVTLVFKSDKEGHEQPVLSDEQRNIAQNAYRLLHTWRRPPGTRDDDSFDEQEFVTWLDKVKRRTTESGHYRVAMSQIGQVLPYVLPDKDGLWIHHVVARALDERDVSEMRTGFTVELFNMRGVYSYSAGKEERAIAAGLRLKAEALELQRYTRFAAAIRKLAENYEADAEREASRSPFGDE